MIYKPGSNVWNLSQLVPVKTKKSPPLKTPIIKQWAAVYIQLKPKSVHVYDCLQHNKKNAKDYFPEGWTQTVTVGAAFHCHKLRKQQQPPPPHPTPAPTPPIQHKETDEQIHHTGVKS